VENRVPGRSVREVEQSLVLQHLRHCGFVETANAFAQEVRNERAALELPPIPGMNTGDDQDAANRQSGHLSLCLYNQYLTSSTGIRAAIVHGNIDEAIRLTTELYPKVLDSNEQVKFRLRCRKFIEMVRKAAELKLTEVKINGKSPVGHGAQEMDVDSNGDDDSKDTKLAADIAILESRTVEFGRVLQSQYGADGNKKQELDKIFSLMAYSEVFKAPGSYLLDRRGRDEVAEEVNSAILCELHCTNASVWRVANSSVAASLGCNPDSALETFVRRTEEILENLRQDGGPATFVSTRDVFDRIPRRDPPSS
jgi:Ran-binding protein 9/10